MDLAKIQASDRGVQRSRALRYRVEMKKTTRKLVIRSETLRALRVLDNKDLTRAVGGSAAPLRESGDLHCPALAVVTMAACG